MEHEPVLEVRVVCRSFGRVPGHHEHKWVKDDLELTRRYRDKLTDEMTGQSIAPVEMPYRIQARMVSPFIDIPDEVDDAT